jgi:hypothetical protein
MAREGWRLWKPLSRLQVPFYLKVENFRAVLPVRGKIDQLLAFDSSACDEGRGSSHVKRDETILGGDIKTRFQPESSR